MALPNQLKSARMTDATTGNTIDNHVGDLEIALCEILGFTEDVNVTESPLLCDNSGRITKQLLRLASTAPMGIRFRDTTNGKEFRLALNNTAITIDENTGSEGTPSWTNRLTIALGTGLPTLAGATDPSAANDLSRKGYVDGLDAANVKKTGAQSIDGVKTFTSIPVGPASNPTTDNQLARKAYVDSVVSAADLIHLIHRQDQGTHGGNITSLSWNVMPLNFECVDTGGDCTLSSNQFTLAAGTYEIFGNFTANSANWVRLRLYNVTDGEVQEDLNSKDIVGVQVMTNYYSPPTIFGRFALPSAKTLRVEYYAKANSTNGLGLAMDVSGEEERYADLWLHKVA